MRILRLITSKSIEEHILARAQYKLDLDGKVIQAGKFDNKTTDAEREELLRSLFGEKDDEDKEEDDEDISMNDDELNEVLARDEEELAIFRRLDDERESKDIMDWQGLGKNSPWNKSRLMVESELPPVYLVDVNQVLEQERAESDAVLLGRGSRERKSIHYDEVLSEEQWVEAVERGEDIEALSSRKRNARKRAMGEHVEEEPVKKGKKKKKGLLELTMTHLTRLRLLCVKQ